MRRGVAIPDKQLITEAAPRPAGAPAAGRAASVTRRGEAARSRSAGAAARAASAGTREASAESPRAAALRPASAAREASAEPQAAGLSARPATAADLPWLQTWAAHLGLPAPRARQVRSFILLKDSQRVGYLAGREDMLDAGRGREPVMWIVSAFLIPTLRGQGLLMKFGEILSRTHYPKGKIACRVAADNSRMLRLVSHGGWQKLRTTRRFSDFVLELDGPFRAPRTARG